jgi:2-polyprenyl-3-methyl-5-hydroxy-6-metoxy-1,4-benzoquinol methylase
VARHFIVAAILDAVRALPDFPRLRVLDLSCGRGELLASLRARGCDVRGTHFRGDDYEIKSGKEDFLTGAVPESLVDPNVDLTKPLPYADASFDVVILSEVVEHLPQYITVIHEAGRVLAPGGHLVLSTPNVQRLHSRWKFFRTGTHKLIRERPDTSVTRDELYAYHINPLDFPLAHTLLHQAGLQIERLRFTRFKPEHAWLFLFWPLVWIATRAEIRDRDLFRWLTKPQMLASEQLLIVAGKVPR